jgi:hypothetical protein
LAGQLNALMLETDGSHAPLTSAPAEIHAQDSRKR